MHFSGRPLLLFPLHCRVMWVQTHTEHVPSSVEMMVFSCAAHRARVRLTALFINKDQRKQKINPGVLNQIILFWTTVFPPLLYWCQLCLNNWISSAACSQSASKPQTKNPHLMSAKQVRFWLWCSDPQSRSKTHILFKSTSYLLFYSSNMNGKKYRLI